MDMKEDQQLWCKTFFLKKLGPRARTITNEELAQELHKPVIESLKEEK